MTMREFEIMLSDGKPLWCIAFPCRNAPACKNEVLVDAQHPNFAYFKRTLVARCNACIASDREVAAPLPMLPTPLTWPP